MLTMYSQVLINVPVPIVMYRKGHGLRVIWFELFKLFPVSVSKKTLQTLFYEANEIDLIRRCIRFND